MFRIKLFFTFMLGFTIGAVLAVLLLLSRTRSKEFITDQYSLNNAAFTFNKNQSKYDVFDVNKLGLRISKYRISKKKVLRPNYNSHVLCVIFSSDLSNTFAASKSWAKHCNDHHFIGMDDGKNKVDFKYLNVTVFKPKHSWHFLCESIIYLYKLYKKTIQWVIFVHDDVFVIPENLRYYVMYKDYTKPYYLGDISCFWSTFYNTAEAGFVLSRGAIKLLFKKFNTSRKCESSGKHWKTEDYYLGKHLSASDVHPEDTRDNKGRGRFHTFTPEQLYSPTNSALFAKYFKRRIYPNVQGPNCCSDKTITFQGTSQSRIFLYYYLVYFIKPYVLKDNNPNNLSRIYQPSQLVWKNFVSEELGKNVDFNKIDADKYYYLWLNKVSPNELNAILRKEASNNVYFKLLHKPKSNIDNNHDSIL